MQTSFSSLFLWIHPSRSFFLYIVVAEEIVFVFVQRSYNISLPHKKIPDALCQLARRLAEPAMPCGEEFQPEAAIINYFGLGLAL